MDVEQFLRDAGVEFQRCEHPAAYTAQEVAAEEHVSGDAVAKPVVVRADEETLLCVLPASRKIDLGKLAKAVKAKHCTLVDEAELARLFPDVEVGAEPPFGKPYGLRTVVDAHLAGHERITFTAGTHRTAIQMKYSDYAKLVEATVADFSVHL